MAKPIRSARTSLGSGLTGTGTAIGGFNLWDRDVVGVVVGLMMLGVGLWLMITGLQRDRRDAAPPE